MPTTPPDGLQIDGLIVLPDGLTPEAFFDAFTEFMVQKNATFEGGVMPVDTDMTEDDYRPLIHIDQGDIDSLSKQFTADGYQYANFRSFWSNFISEDPSLSDVLDLLVALEEMGYMPTDDK